METQTLESIIDKKAEYIRTFFKHIVSIHSLIIDDLQHYEIEFESIEDSNIAVNATHSHIHHLIGDEIYQIEPLTLPTSSIIRFKFVSIHQEFKKIQTMLKFIIGHFANEIQSSDLTEEQKNTIMNF